jgi:hypothetical protein
MNNHSDAAPANIDVALTYLDLDVTELDARLEMAPIGVRPDWWIGGGAD